MAPQVQSVTFSPAKAEAVETPTGGTDDHVCEACGAPVYRPSGRGRWPKYCEDHKGASSTASTATGGSGKAKKSKGKAASEEQWTQFMTMGLLMGTYVVGRFAAGGHGLMLDPPAGMDVDTLDDIADQLGMQPDEAGPIAKLIAKKTTPSVINKKYGYMIVAALDLEEVGGALWTYGKRIGPVLSQRIQSQSKGASAASRVHVPKVRQFTSRKVAQDVTPTAQASPSTGPAVPSNADIVAAANARQRQFAPPDIGDDSGTP